MDVVLHQLRRWRIHLAGGRSSICTQSFLSITMSVERQRNAISMFTGVVIINSCPSYDSTKQSYTDLRWDNVVLTKCESLLTSCFQKTINRYPVSLVYNLHADKASRRIGEAVAQALVWEEQACLLMLCELVISVYSKKPIIDVKLGNCALGYQNLTTT
jgi:hypothetical protein